MLTCEKNGQKWEGAETPRFTVTYTDLYGRQRHHYPDLFVDNHIVVEVKPAKHQRGKLVQLKAKAMTEFCNKHNYVYMMVSPRRIPKDKLKELFLSGSIKILDEYIPAFKRYLGL